MIRAALIVTLIVGVFAWIGRTDPQERRVFLTGLTEGASQ